MRALWISVLLAGALLASDKEDVLKQMDARAVHYGEVSKKIWDFAELGYHENKSAALLESELRQAGFSVTENVAGIPTAFTATWGQGKPVIAILGEYDALPGLSQQEMDADRKPLVAGGPGHGCGHNLLGTASLFAAVTVKDWLAAKKLPGTIRFYGTPAEEGGGGKIYMARAGVFQDVDAVLTWHPGDSNMASKESSLAITEAKFRFYGKPAHAAAAPDLGRSALDAVMITANAIEFLREHVPESTRIHYIVSNGGAAPNIVPDFAELFLYARNPSMPVLDGIWERIVNCAKAGALATDTRMEVEMIDSNYNTLPNDALSAMVDRNLHIVGGVTYSKEEEEFAERLRKTVALDHALPLGSQEKIQTPRDGYFSASTDAGDVSWMLPTSELNTATFVPGIPAHSWQATACAGSSIGRKGMVVAAKTLALSAMDLFTDPAQLKAARDSFEQRRAGYEYKSRIPPDHKPPLNYRDKD
ncbi:MAG TPA: amidohydrolase [Bryobacteraceae bacterium]|nr:amidohydrolase [Bryobacteraceae bacterium]